MNIDLNEALKRELLDLNKKDSRLEAKEMIQKSEIDCLTRELMVLKTDIVEGDYIRKGGEPPEQVGESAIKIWAN